MVSQIPRWHNPLRIDEHMYRCRHLIENFFGNPKAFKHITMCSDKTDSVSRLQKSNLSIDSMAKKTGSS